MKTHWGLVAVAGICLVLAAPGMADVFDMGPGLASLEFVPVGDPGNAGELSGEGSDGFFPYGVARANTGAVAYEYFMGKYEVTAAQYTEFLNAVAATDTYGLYNTGMAHKDKPPTGAYFDRGCHIERSGVDGSYTYSVYPGWDNRPVNYVSSGDAFRFINWLHNGQPTGAQDLTTTEDGAYFLNGINDNASLLAVTREADAAYFLPTEDEWYKAAYYDPTLSGGAGGYYNFAMQTDNEALVHNDILPVDDGSGANYKGFLSTDITLPAHPEDPGPVPQAVASDVGEFENSGSYYGTFDQSGNLSEFVHEVFKTDRFLGRGGHCAGYIYYITAGTRHYPPFPTTAGPTYGFRVAMPAPEPPRIEALEVFYNGKYADAADPAKSFLALGEASSMSRVGDDLHGNVTNCSQGITGIRVKFDAVVAFSGGVAAAFSYEATPEQSADKTFTAFTPPTSPVYVADDGSGKTIVTITFTDGEIKNRWLKTIIDASQVSANGADLDGELTAPLTFPSGDGTAGGNAEFIIGNRFGDVDANYRCLLNDAIAIRSKASGVLVGISNAYDVDKNERALLNDAILTRNAVSGTALPALP